MHMRGARLMELTIENAYAIPESSRIAISFLNIFYTKFIIRKEAQRSGNFFFIYKPALLVFYSMSFSKININV